MRRTRQRRDVWDAVQQLGGHCTADEITSAIQRRQPSVSRSTVYRALDALTTSGALQAVRLGDAPVRYEVASAPHQHAVCQRCERVFHVEQALVDELERHLRAHHRFTPLRTGVVVIGLCDVCAEGRRPPPGPRTVEHRHFPPR
jgi:Fe2+ or Zn2+ uptake regulation protein